MRLKPADGAAAWAPQLNALGDGAAMERGGAGPKGDDSGACDVDRRPLKKSSSDMDIKDGLGGTPPDPGTASGSARRAATLPSSTQMQKSALTPQLQQSRPPRSPLSGRGSQRRG